MTPRGQGWLRKAARLLGLGAPLQLASDEIFAIRPGAAVTPTIAYGPSGAARTAEPEKPYRMLAGGIAEIHIAGMLSKHPSLFRLFGCSDQPTLPELAAAVRAAAADAEVAGILLFVESPGGTAHGTPELAAEVAAAAAVKPVHAYAQDECCSAAYWIASQADRLSANLIAAIGSIGAYAILLDASEAAGAAGLKFHVIATGPFKGAAAEPGAGISAEQLAYFRQRVEDTNGYFIEGVAAGRQLPLAAVRELADGRCYITAKAVALGLADAVGTYAEAVAALTAAIDSPREPRPAVRPPPPEPAPPSDPMTPPEPPEEEEQAMSKETKVEASAGTTGAEEEKRGVLASLGRLLGLGGDPAATGAPAPGGATAAFGAEVDKRIKAEVAARLQEQQREQEVDRDLAALAEKVPPAVLRDAETRVMLLEAKAKGPEQYGKRLAIVAGNDASHLLGGWIAGEAETGAGRAGLGVNAKELAALEACGMTVEQLTQLERKYDLRPRPAAGN